MLKTRSRGAATFVLLSLCAAACSSIFPPAPTPSPVDCWVALRGEYRLTTLDGGDPSAEDVAAAAQIVHSRLERLGLADFQVRTEGPLIFVDLPLIGDEAAVRDLVRPTGEFEFVPIPPGQDAQVGDQLPAGLQPLFGRDGIASVTRAVTQTGQAAVDFTLTDNAATALDEHAAGHLGEQLAIALDGIVLAAPTLQAQSFDGRIQVSGGFGESEGERLLTILRLPTLPGRLLELGFGEVPPLLGCPAGD